MKNSIIKLNQKEVSLVIGGCGKRLHGDEFDQRLEHDRGTVFCFICLFGSVVTAAALITVACMKDKIVNGFDYYIIKTVHDLRYPEKKEKRESLQAAANNPFI